MSLRPGVFGTIADFLDGFSDLTGRAVAWLTPAMVVLSFAVVITRYFFGANTTALKDTVMYMHATLFLLGAAYALNKGAHVRVDILHRSMSMRHKAWVEAIGCIIFLLPFCGLIAFSSWNYVLQSWQVSEGARDSNGLPLVYLLKSLLPLAATTLALQGIADTCHSLSVLIHGDSVERTL
jgi:TRAP-type mannitol/chloroaromatic compound transport system permease small subunit